jgi:hypothetical protein
VTANLAADQIGYLRLLFGALCADQDEVEARSMLAFFLAVGHHFIAAGHGARSHADVLDLAASWLLASQRASHASLAGRCYARAGDCERRGRLPRCSASILLGLRVPRRPARRPCPR